MTAPTDDSDKDEYPDTIHDTTQGHPEEPHDHTELVDNTYRENRKDPYPPELLEANTEDNG